MASIEALEHELRDFKSELAKLSLAVAELSDRSERRRESIQAAVDDLQNSINLIYENVRIPNIDFNPHARSIIE